MTSAPQSRGTARLGAAATVEAVAPALRCPVCAGALTVGAGTARCPRGHSFDLARQGYLNLAAGRRPAHAADTAAMVAARQRFLERGHYGPVAERLSRLAGEHERPPGLVVDLAGGTGYHLAAVLDRLPSRYGVCLDLSTAALRRAARAHPRALGVGTDVWGTLPLGDGCASVVTSVFGPRNAVEIERVLRPGGVLVVATPTRAHLAEVVAPLGMLGVDATKPARLAAAFARLETVTVTTLDYRVALDHDTLTALVQMGPSAHHLTDEQLAARVRRLPAMVDVTVSVRFSVWRRP